MSFRVVSFETTPNPNAIKCVLDRSPTEVPRSYFNATQATGDELAEALFAAGEVTSVLIHTEFITVNKAPGAGWPGLKRQIERVLRDAD
ncbi:MAG: NifU N-terminal domain-containing protein [Planctomycetota bacterium]